MLACKNISYGFSLDNNLLEDLSFQLAYGELLEVIGANGSGKTTLLKILAGLRKPTSGNIILNNKSAPTKSNWQNIIYLGHNQALHPDLTAVENLQFYAKINKVNCRVAHIIEALSMFNIAHLANKYCKSFSAGQLQKLDLTRLILEPALIWFLDEPLAAIDSKGEEIFTSILDNHLQNQGIAVIATHKEIAISRKQQICL